MSEQEQVQEVQQPKRPVNWADMDNEEEGGDQEIGLQQEETKQEAASDKPKRVRKDYGKDYDPDYKKKHWRKDDKQGSKQPAIARQKNERGDYVVTSFNIPDRVVAKDKVQGEEKQKKRRVGAFQVDSDEEEEEQQQEAATEEPVEEKVEEAKAEPVHVATQKPLSKKEQKKKEMEELEALLGLPTPAAEAKPEAAAAQTTDAAAAEGKKKKKKNKAKAATEEPVAEATPATEAPELTPEQKEAAIKEALKKRNAAAQAKAGGSKDQVLLTAKIEKAERKQKAKRAGAKGEDYDR